MSEDSALSFFSARFSLSSFLSLLVSLRRMCLILEFVNVCRQSLGYLCG